MMRAGKGVELGVELPEAEAGSSVEEREGDGVAEGVPEGLAPKLMEAEGVGVGLLLNTCRVEMATVTPWYSTLLSDLKRKVSRLLLLVLVTGGTKPEKLIKGLPPAAPW